MSTTFAVTPENRSVLGGAARRPHDASDHVAGSEAPPCRADECLARLRAARRGRGASRFALVPLVGYQYFAFPSAVQPDAFAVTLKVPLAHAVHTRFVVAVPSVDT